MSIIDLWRDAAKKLPSYRIIQDTDFIDGVYGSVEGLIKSLESGMEERHWLALVRNNALNEDKIKVWLADSGYDITNYSAPPPSSPM